MRVTASCRLRRRGGRRPVGFLRELLGAPGGEIKDITELEVRRASLEDTYMALVHRHESGSDTGSATGPTMLEGVPA